MKIKDEEPGQPGFRTLRGVRAKGNFQVGHFSHLEGSDLGKNVSIGQSTIIHSRVRIGDGVVIGNRVTVCMNVSIGKGAVVEDGAIILTNVRIGSDARVDGNAVVGNSIPRGGRAMTEWAKVIPRKKNGHHPSDG